MWTYKGKEINSFEDLGISEGFGFVYKITNLENGKFYIGKKNFYSELTKALGKKELALITDKRKSKFKTVIKQSDWLSYNSSCKPLLLDLENNVLFSKEIIEIALFQKQLTYLELKNQIIYDVLGSDSYNENILGKFYKRDLN